MCVCDNEGFWACESEGSCGPGHLRFETYRSVSGRADDNHSSDPSPVDWDEGDTQDGGEWYCHACGASPTPVWVIPYAECCAENGLDANGEPLDIEDQVEEQCTESWVWLVREDDDSWSNVARLSAIDFDFPEEVTKLYERRSISRLLVTGERALEVVEYLGHSAVCVRTMTQHEIEMYVPTPEEAKEEAQCRLTV